MTNQFKELKNLNPVLLEDEYVFCTFLSSIYGDHNKLNPIASFNEKEGLTLVVKKEIAKFNNLEFKGTFKCISLNLISSLTSVGLTALISKALADNEISANIYAGYYHDHIFVPLEKANDAFKLLCE
ncbi:ACT domain-containing protein, partial [Pelagibacterales bacterium]|nr:ACT domain-containing protein [Pelagibacterales bacterium]